MILSEASQITRVTLDKHGLTHVEVVFNARLTSAFGRYKWNTLTGRRVIELSSKLVAINDAERVTRTILHEVAHALTEGHHHDAVWQRKCIEIGGDGRIHYSRNDTNTLERSSSSKRYQLRCVDCGYTGSRVYRRKMHGYGHRGCGGRLINIEL